MTSSLGGYVTAVLVRKTVKLVCSEGMQADAGKDLFAFALIQIQIISMDII